MKQSLRKAFLAALCLIAAALSVCGVAACSKEPANAVYTVTVACEDGVPESVKVQMKSGETIAAEEKPVGGSVAFELPKGTYTVTLAGVPDGYFFEEQTVTEKAPNAAILLTRGPIGEEVEFVVTVTCADDVLSGVTVQLLQGETVAAEQPLKEGKATFSLHAGTYTVKLKGLPADYAYEEVQLTPLSQSATVAVTHAAAGKIEYRITVLCADDVLRGVRVRLLADGNPVAEEALENGKATFLLAEGSYDVALVNLPAGYSHGAARVTKDAPQATVRVTKEAPKEPVTYSVTLSYGQAADVFGGTHVQSAAAGLAVSLYENDTDTRPAATAVTDGNGHAEFQLMGEKYFVSVASPSYRLSAAPLTKAAPVLNAVLAAKDVLGTQNAPILLALGENEIPFTEQFLDAHPDGVFYVFIPAESGDYYFSTSDRNALITSSLFPEDLSGRVTNAVKRLTAGTPYFFTANSGGDVSGEKEGEKEFSYALTISQTPIEEPTDPDPGPDPGPGPQVTWDGEGTADSPYIITDLLGVYEVVVEYRGGAFDFVYFSYTAMEDGDYLATGLSSEYLVYFGSAFIHPSSPDSINDDSSVRFRLRAGEKLVIRVENYSDDLTASFTAKFKIETYVAPPPVLGSKENPEKLTDLIGAYHVVISPAKLPQLAYYYVYTATADADYIITTSYAEGVHFSLREGSADSAATSYSVSASGHGVAFRLQAGKTYYLGFSSDGDGEIQVVTLDFEIKAGTVSEPDGTENNPYPMQTFLGGHTIEAGTDGVWYSFVLEEDTTVVITAKTKCILNVGGKSKQFGRVGMTETFALKAGEVKLFVQFFGPDGGTVEFTVAVAPVSAAASAPATAMQSADLDMVPPNKAD